MQEQTRRSLNMVRLEPRPTPSIHGRPRILEDIKRLEHETMVLEEELKELDRGERTSTVCGQVSVTIERIPDPFLPVTKGPENPAWSQWFKEPVESQSCCCCI